MTVQFVSVVSQGLQYLNVFHTAVIVVCVYVVLALTHGIK